MFTSRRRRALGAVGFLGLLFVLAAVPVLGHEERTVAGYDMEVGFIDEPVYTGERSGLEFSVMKDDQPVTGLESTLQAEVIYGDAHRDLPVSARDDAPGWYESVFIPTAAGPYTFHIYGSIEGQQVDESFTSSPTGFDEVKDLAGGQFPTTLPSLVDVQAAAQRGAAAADQVTIALALGGLGVILGLIALGLSLATVMRRRAA
ncbi:MAG TPA: hypothetical protein VH371_04660 [Candidatus Limnocylindrales bacterium]